MSTLNQRKNYFDLLRVISSFAVVVIHVTSAAMNTTEVSSQTYMANALLNSIMRWAVPVFFMISGALFLDPKREVTTKKALYKDNSAYCYMHNYMGRYLLHNRPILIRHS